MYYNEYKPSKDLAGYIECYWQMKFPANFAATRDLIVPGGRVEIMINIGKPLIFVSSAGKSFALKNNIYILGQRNTFFTTFFHPGIYMWGIRFRPAGFYSFCKSPAAYLLNELMEAADIFKSINISRLYAKLIAEQHSHRQVEVIESFLRNVLHAGKLSDDSFNETMALIRDCYQYKSIYDYCTKNKLYYKKLERQFLQCAGYTPKEFFNIRRFYNAVRLIYKSETSLTDICHSLGFYDQSHFIKDFKNYASLPPLKFIKGAYQIPRLVTSSAIV
jgi:AraC-like DNA-binding protein